MDRSACSDDCDDVGAFGLGIWQLVDIPFSVLFGEPGMYVFRRYVPSQ